MATRPTFAEVMTGFWCCDQSHAHIFFGEKRLISGWCGLIRIFMSRASALDAGNMTYTIRRDDRPWWMGCCCCWSVQHPSPASISSDPNPPPSQPPAIILLRHKQRCPMLLSYFCTTIVAQKYDNNMGHSRLWARWEVKRPIHLGAWKRKFNII